jgi:DnaJ-class molecular chaperone
VDRLIIGRHETPRGQHHRGERNPVTEEDELMPSTITCPVCGGSGKEGKETCGNCDGRKTVQVPGPGERKGGHIW